MMNEPPIDKLAEKTGGNKYILSILASKRAKEIEATRREELATADKKAIQIALQEIYDGKITYTGVQEQWKSLFHNEIL